MLLIDALNQIIDDGIEAARADYTKPRDKLKLDGSVRGFEDCRGKNPKEILDLIRRAEATCTVKHREQANDYWYWRCRALEVAWVANVLSHILVANGHLPIAMMTARGGLKAADIIGVAERTK